MKILADEFKNSIISLIPGKGIIVSVLVSLVLGFGAGFAVKAKAANQPQPVAQSKKFNDKQCADRVSQLLNTLGVAASGVTKEQFTDYIPKIEQSVLDEAGVTREDLADMVNFVFKYASPGPDRAKDQNDFVSKYVKQYCKRPLNSKDI